MARIMITGASGYLGARLAIALSKQSDGVALLLRASSIAPDPGAFAHPPVVLRFQDQAMAGDLLRTHKPDVLVHTACCYGRAGETLSEMIAANYLFGWALLEASLEAGVGLFMNTDTVLPAGLNAYAFTKAQFVELARFVQDTRATSIRFANLKLQTMYGPGDHPTKFTTALARHVVANRAPLDITPGTQRRDFVHVDDVVSAIATVIEKRHSLARWEDIPVGTGKACRLRDFVDVAVEVSGFEQAVRPVLAHREGEPPELKANTARLQELGWLPKVDLRSGIAALIEDARNTAMPRP
jgi:nucleoside-diphosphate-sugar epimerase